MVVAACIKHASLGICVQGMLDTIPRETYHCDLWFASSLVICVRGNAIHGETHITATPVSCQIFSLFEHSQMRGQLTKSLVLVI